ncbi:hypothetical protein [Devriesea agamarum]|uniref:hypothetical protein n=1 Tax=Devriesea agamarum TaxID=472569 RepID=UPI00071D3807|nr:hypothetical protein [Devriesea agamarum]
MKTQSREIVFKKISLSMLIANVVFIGVILGIDVFEFRIAIYSTVIAFTISGIILSALSRSVWLVILHVVVGWLSLPLIFGLAYFAQMMVDGTP